MSIKAIQTEYNGYKFRSRLEARWAVFFDNAGIKYEYEPEGYDLDGSLRYLPDFYLPQLDIHVEVKRDTEDGRAEIVEKCFKSIKWGGPIKRILILSDVPEGKSIDGGLWHFPALYWRDDGVDIGWWFFYGCGDEDPVEGNISRATYRRPIISDDRPLFKNRCSIKAVSDENLKDVDSRFNESLDDKIWFQEDMNKRVFTALKAARQARFEYGETPTKEDIA